MDDMSGNAVYAVQEQVGVKKVYGEFGGYWMYVYFCKNRTGYFSPF